MRELKRVMLFVCCCASIVACKKETSEANFTSKVEGNDAASVSTLQNIDISSSEIGVVELPASVDQKIRSTFYWYTKVDAPNGKPIHLLAQSNWTEEQVAYTRVVLEHYLTNAPIGLYGDKSTIANSIADQNGAMTMFNNADAVSNNESGVNGQDLQADETVAVGTLEYLDASLRNAALEEILHFVHDLGIAPSYPEFQMELETATVNALDNQIFTPWGGLPVADYDNELLAAYNDAYWGLTEHNSGFDNPYLYLSREAAVAGDPLTTAFMNKFLPTYWTSTQFVASSFQGTFHLTKDASLVYTNQSQYYKDVQLLGTLNSDLHGNNYDNELIGNDGNNVLKGANGNDVLNGSLGVDQALYQYPYAEYTITTVGGVTTIGHPLEGTDTLTNVEEAVFPDQTVTL